jgi:hypothetical protein
MRTVLYRIRLLIDKMEIHDRVFILNNLCGGESKTAERQKERQCERQCMRGSVSNKLDCFEKILMTHAGVI